MRPFSKIFGKPHRRIVVGLSLIHIFEPQRETKTQQAKDLICTLLAGGKQVLSEDIDKAALERGIPGRTVRDAKRELGDALKSKIVEGRKKVFWME